MRRDRFEQIRSMMRFADPLNESSGSLNKLSYFLNHLSYQFKTNYIPGEYIAVDEFLSKWKGVCILSNTYLVNAIGIVSRFICVVKAILGTFGVS